MSGRSRIRRLRMRWRASPPRWRPPSANHNPPEKFSRSCERLHRAEADAALMFLPSGASAPPTRGGCDGEDDAVKMDRAGRSAKGVRDCDVRGRAGAHFGDVGNVFYE